MKKEKTSDSFDRDIGTIAICAVRYALGRQTYMPGIVQDFVMRHPEIVTENVRDVMLRDIKEHDRITEHTLPSGKTMMLDGLGDTKIDRPGWIKFKAWLEGLDIDGKGENK